MKWNSFLRNLIQNYKLVQKKNFYFKSFILWSKWSTLELMNVLMDVNLKIIIKIVLRHMFTRYVIIYFYRFELRTYIYEPPSIMVYSTVESTKAVTYIPIRMANHIQLAKWKRAVIHPPTFIQPTHISIRHLSAWIPC